MTTMTCSRCAEVAAAVRDLSASPWPAHQDLAAAMRKVLARGCPHLHG